MTNPCRILRQDAVALNELEAYLGLKATTPQHLCLVRAVR